MSYYTKRSEHGFKVVPIYVLSHEMFGTYYFRQTSPPIGNQLQQGKLESGKLEEFEQIDDSKIESRIISTVDKSKVIKYAEDYSDDLNDWLVLVDSFYYPQKLYVSKLIVITQKKKAYRRLSSQYKLKTKTIACLRIEGRLVPIQSKSILSVSLITPML